MRQGFVNQRVCVGKEYFVDVPNWRVNLLRVTLLQFEALALYLTECSSFYCFTQQGGLKQTAPYHSNWLMTRGVKTFICFKPFTVATASLLCSQIVLMGQNKQTAFWNFESLFMICSFRQEDLLFEKITKILHSRENDWITYRVRKNLCFHRLKTIYVSTGPGQRNIVRTDRLFLK